MCQADWSLFWLRFGGFDEISRRAGPDIRVRIATCGTTATGPGLRGLLSSPRTREHVDGGDGPSDGLRVLLDAHGALGSDPVLRQPDGLFVGASREGRRQAR